MHTTPARRFAIPRCRLDCAHARGPVRSASAGTVSVLLLCVLLACTPTANAAAAGAATDASGAARRAAMIEEIVVTSDYRHATLDQFAGSAAVLDAAAIAQRSAVHLEELLGSMVNLNATAGSSRARFYQIRGIGERSQFAEPLNPSVGLLLDGVDFSGLGAAATTFDVAQVELLRGPQGTRYGANALAGLISVQSRAPTATPELALHTEVADYGTYSVGAAGGGPLVTDRLLYRLAVQKHRSEGYIDNRTVRREHTNDLDELTSRARLRWLPTNALTLDLTAGFIDINNGYDAFSLDPMPRNGKRITLSDQPGKDMQRSRYVTIASNWTASPAFTVTSQVSAEHSNIDYGYDEDWTFVGFHPDGYSSTDRYRRDRHSASAEVRVVSGQDGRLFNDSTDWLGGIYAIREDVALQRSYTFFSSLFDSDFTTHRVAAFGEARVHLAEAWSLTTGVRLESRRARYSDSEAVRFSPDESLWGGNITLARTSDAGTLLYATLSRGYKAGGFNTDGTLPTNLREYQDEYAISLEAGAKGTLFDGALSYRLALFNMLRHDVQIASSKTIVRADNSAEFIDFVGNAAAGNNRGAEIEGDYRPTAELRFFAGIGFLSTEYRKFVNSAGQRLDGRDQAQAPRYSYSTGVEYRLARHWLLHAEAEGKDRYFFDDSNNTRSHAYSLLHARLNYDADRWHVALWGRNLLDKDYQTRGFFFGNDPRIGYAERSYTQLGEPRRFGITASLDL